MHKPDGTENPAELATFVVHVRYHKNATWQGDILWAQEGREQSFRSALEMLKLMDSAIESTGDAPDSAHKA
jgi:hypothetical protein